MAWRDTARKAKFYFLDAQSAAPLLLCLLHARLWTFGLAIFSMGFFWFIGTKGYSLPVFLRWIRTKASGPRKYSIPSRLKRGMYDC